MKKSSKTKKILTLMICLDLAIFLVVGVTLAYVFTTSETVVNTFTPVTPDIEITEDFKNNIKENVAVKNAGSVSSYVRAKVVITWQYNGEDKDKKGNIFPITPILGTDYTISYGTAWKQAADGFWYYGKAVEPGALTGSADNPEGYLIKTAQPLKACQDPTYTLHIEILSQSVQSTPDSAVNVWDSAKVDVTGNAGTLTVVTPQTN